MRDNVWIKPRHPKKTHPIFLVKKNFIWIRHSKTPRIRIKVTIVEILYCDAENMKKILQECMIKLAPDPTVFWKPDPNTTPKSASTTLIKIGKKDKKCNKTKKVQSKVQKYRKEKENFLIWGGGGGMVIIIDGCSFHIWLCAHME